MELSIEGCRVICTDHLVFELDDLRPGDLYAARRNTGWKVLTCRQVVYSTCQKVHGEHPCSGPGGKHPDFVVPEENAYCYDSWECFRVLDIVDASRGAGAAQ